MIQEVVTEYDTTLQYVIGYTDDDVELYRVYYYRNGLLVGESVDVKHLGGIGWDTILLWGIGYTNTL